MTSPVYGFPELTPTTVERTNTNLVVRYLESLMGAVPTVNVSTVPTAPSDGSVWLINGVPTGIWSDKAGQVGIYTVSGWFYVPTHPKYLYSSGTWGSSVSGGSGGGTGRVTLTADRTYYVRTTGTRTGALTSETTATTDTDVDAFGTINNAINALKKIDCNGFIPSIFVGAGTFDEQTILPSLVGADSANIVGAGTALTTVLNNGSTTLYVPSGVFQSRKITTAWKISNLKISTTTNDRSALLCDGSSLYFENLTFDSHYIDIWCISQGYIEALGNYSITKNKTLHIACETLGYIRIQNRTITITGTPNWGEAFLTCRYGASFVIINSNSFVGTATGTRYSVGYGASVLSSGPNTYLPGSVDGSVSNDGKYYPL
jgi:Protein of unknown function (DUF2793)